MVIISKQKFPNHNIEIQRCFDAYTFTPKIGVKVNGVKLLKVWNIERQQDISAVSTNDEVIINSIVSEITKFIS